MCAFYPCEAKSLGILDLLAQSLEASYLPCINE